MLPLASPIHSRALLPGNSTGFLCLGQFYSFSRAGSLALQIALGPFKPVIRDRQANCSQVIKDEEGSDGLKGTQQRKASVDS